MLHDRQNQDQTSAGTSPGSLDDLFKLGNNPDAAFDYAGLLARVDHDRSVAAEIVAVFLQDAPRLVAGLQEARRQRDAGGGGGGGLRRAAHALNGASASVGASLIRERAAWLEVHADIADTNAIARVVESMDALLISFREATQRRFTAEV